ncbi:MAG TPA: argininosuccinate lyase [Acidimicrobiales bacterium]|nr:argininosuccinate lyase [Acidimicrobiales bacterium]
MTDAGAFVATNDQQRLDLRLAEYDCWATRAHVRMLVEIGVMRKEDGALALEALGEIEELSRSGAFPYDPKLGAQLSLEQALVERVGAAIGYQVHTGRSRNDEVTTAQKLYVRDAVLELMGDLVVLVDVLLARAAASVTTVMPGYTHMQPARPTSVAQWCGAYAEMCLGDLGRLRDALERADSSPLGAAESYGTSWPLDRALTAELLCFSRVDEIPIAAISTRGESDLDVLAAMSFLALHLSKMAQDLLLFTTFEYRFARLGAAQATRMGKLTGSSIMPQKRNPDVLEILRAGSSEIHSYLMRCLELLNALPSGYNRDGRETKGPIMDGIDRTRSNVAQMAQVMLGLEFDEERMLAAVRANYSMATDLSERLAQQFAVPSRIMYRVVGRVVDALIESGRPLEAADPEQLRLEAEREGYDVAISAEELAKAIDPRAALERRRTLGGAASVQMASWQQRREADLAAVAGWIEARRSAIAAARFERPA